MKRFLLSSVLILLSFLFVSGQNITVQINGTVTDAANGTPVANHMVQIMTDSMSGTFYYSQVFTNNQGLYSDAVVVPQNAQVVFYISTTDCNGNYLYQNGVSTNSPIIANFSICTGTSSNCQANFMAIPDSGNPSGGLTYYFWDLSTGNPIAWAWNFGDGTTSNLQYPVHTYQQAGVYTVTLSITTASGCSSTFTSIVNVTIPSNCNAYFNSVADSSGYGFQFTDLSTGTPSNWQWSFGDGSTSNLQNPFHVYNAPGSYYVCLTIWGNNCQSSYCDYVYVTGTQGCMAEFWAFPDSSGTNTWMFADNSIGNVIDWAWSFGDGTYSNLQYPVHTYATTGIFQVCLTIYTSDSCTSTYCDTINVGTNPNPCSTYFTYTNNVLAVSFSAWSFGGTSPYTYVWDFGDGTTSTLPNPIHTYTTAGTYVVTLTGSDAAGCSSTYTSNVWAGNQQNGTIWGQIFVDNTYLPQGMVFLYMDGGPSTPMIPIDSTSVDSAGYYHFIILNPLPGTYYVKALPAPGTVYYLTHLPTYYGNTIFWANATPINLVQPANPYNITLVAVNPAPQGNGNITGEVTNSGKFNSALSAPAPNIEVMLLSMSNSPLGIDYSDNQGNFSFNYLAMGSYKIYAEVTGLPTDPAIVTLTANNPTVNDVTVVITPTGVTTGIDDLAPIMSVNKLYPNPAKDKVTMEFSLIKSSVMEISLLNILGEKVISTSEEFTAGNHRLNVNLQDLDNGTYLLQVNNAEGNQMTRKITIVK